VGRNEWWFMALQYVWGQDVVRFLKLGNFASTTNKHERRDQVDEFCMLAFCCKSNIGRDMGVKDIYSIKEIDDASCSGPMIFIKLNRNYLCARDAK
jgi:hypothetical protein